MAGERTAMTRMGADMATDIGQPVRIEDHEGGYTALSGAPTELAQGVDCVLTRGVQRAALDLRQHQGERG